MPEPPQRRPSRSSPPSLLRRAPLQCVLAAALSSATDMQLALLHLQSNSICDEGLLALLVPLGGDAGARMASLHFTNNNIGERAMTALVELLAGTAKREGGMPKLHVCNVDHNTTALEATRVQVRETIERRASFEVHLSSPSVWHGQLAELDARRADRSRLGRARAAVGSAEDRGVHRLRRGARQGDEDVGAPRGADGAVGRA